MQEADKYAASSGANWGQWERLETLVTRDHV